MPSTEGKQRDALPLRHQERIFAVRLAQRSGWQLIAAQDEDHAKAHASATFGGKLVEVLPTDVTSSTTRPKLRALGIIDQDLGFRNGQSWAYDEVDDCWRGFGEPITEPSGSPVAVDRLGIHFSLPDAGWVTLKIEGGAQQLSVSLSNSFEAFGNLVEWLEAVLDGGTPRYMVNVEGWLDEFHLFPADDGRLRFVVAYVGSRTPEPPIRILAVDVLITRRALLKSFAEAFCAYWHSPELKEAWTEWAFELNDPEEAPFVPEHARKPCGGLTQRLRTFLAA